MFCSSCGTNNASGATFCSKCGTSLGPATRTIPAQGFAPPKPSGLGNVYSIIGIVSGGVAFLFFPILFGPMGLIFGAVAKSKGEEKAVVALIVSGLGLVVGMFLGILVFSSL